MSELQKLMDETGAFVDTIFPNRPLSAPLGKLKEEVQELCDSPQDDMEYADVLLVLLDAYRTKGGDANQLMNYAYGKLAINKNRKWGKPDENGVFSHIKD